MPPIPDRIEYRNGTQLVADAVASADGLTLRAFDSGGGLVVSLQVNPAGRLDISTGGGVVAFDASGNLDITGLVSLDRLVRLSNLPISDPHDNGVVWRDLDADGAVKVSAG